MKAATTPLFAEHTARSKQLTEEEAAALTPERRLGDRDGWRPERQA